VIGICGIGGIGGSVDGIGNGKPGIPGKPGVGAASSGDVAASPAGRGLGGVLVGGDVGAGAPVGCTGVPMGGSVVGAAPVGAPVVGVVGVEGAIGFAVVVAVAVGWVDVISSWSIAMAPATIPIANTVMAMRSQTERRRGRRPVVPEMVGRFA
jgi:hypothetical protein